MIWINFRPSRNPSPGNIPSRIGISTYVLFRTDNSGFPTPDSAPFRAQAKPKEDENV
jgi:hypothetical protein